MDANEFEFPFAKFATFEQSETEDERWVEVIVTRTIPNMAIIVFVYYMNLKCDDEKMSHYRIVSLRTAQKQLRVFS